MIGTGLIGFGLAGSAFHAPLIATESRLDLVAVASSRPDLVQSRYPAMKVLGDAQRLIDDPGVALVVIAAPNALHAPLAHAALAAGKHVVIDKPFVADVADAQHLIRVAAERGLLVTVFHNRRWDGDFLTVERIVRNGRLGDIRLAALCWDRFRPAIKP